MNRTVVVIKMTSEEEMVDEAIAAYRAARAGKLGWKGDFYVLDLLCRVGTTVPGGGHLLSIVMSHILVGGFVPDEIINTELLLRQKELLMEAELRVVQLQIELKKLEIQQLRLRLQ